MLLGEPARTPYDLNLEVLGFNVRVSVWFWAMALVLGAMYGLLPDHPDHLIILVVVLFGSILLHELGHALAFRHYGMNSRIVLHHTGGVAIPDGGGYSSRRTKWSAVIISAAGPGIQLALAAVVILLVWASGHEVSLPLPSAITSHLPKIEGAKISNVHVASLVNFILFINILWAVFNLLPVYPLDGGQISRELFMMNDRHQGVKNSLILSIATCVAMALWGLQSDNRFLMFMFAIFGFQNFQVLQAYSGRGGGYGGGGSPW